MILAKSQNIKQLFKFEFYESITWILNESEAFICKALKDEAIVCYCESLITQQMKTYSSPFWVKIDEKKRTPSDLLFV